MHRAAVELAKQEPDLAGQVFARLLGKPRFTWQRDGEALLRRYKPRFFDRTRLPGITPLSNHQLAFLRLSTPTAPAGLP